jgi:multidrug efflux pump subunit AcrB
MIKFLINRPVAVFMAFTALFILGVITYINIPVSLLPDIAIPEITVQVSGQNTSARELENTTVLPIRRHLLQIGKLRDIRSETRDGIAIIRLNFEYGTNTDLAFLEVNEKIDAAMNSLPRDIERPRVIKASATDIPVVNLNLTLKSDSAFNETNEDAFIELCEFADNVVRRRIEQLSQVAMVDMTGLVHKQVLIIPNSSLLKTTGITLSDVEGALNSNNVEPGSMVVRDGYYEYNIKFSAAIRTIEDIQNIYLRKNDKLFQLKDLADVSVVSEKALGMAMYNGKRAVTLSVIKQSEENMTDMQQALNDVIRSLKTMYPDVAFDTSQSQTELLDYTISNLTQNLLLAFTFVCLVSAVFLRDVKSPLIIGLSMFVSLIVSLLFFYLFHISLNVVSLTGLILALGMMIDSSIIVTDNIGQHRQKNSTTLDDACVRGTGEVIAPMLSSSLTTISVFVPLIFMSGIAGAIFFDQAFSVTVGLFVSYATGIVLLPVLYKVVYSFRFKKIRERKRQEGAWEQPQEQPNRMSSVEKVYHTCVSWVFSHKSLTTATMIAFLPLCVWLFTLIPKEKMPDMKQAEVMVKVEWNENIHVGENRERTSAFLSAIQPRIVENSALVAQQQFLLNREREQTSSETEIYLRAPRYEDIPILRQEVQSYFSRSHPHAIISFGPARTIFDKIFSTGAPDLTVEFSAKDRHSAPDAWAIRELEKQVAQQTGESPVSVAFHKQINLHINREKLLLYKVSYNDVYRALKTGFEENKFSTLRSYQQYLPIVLGGEELSIREVIDKTLVNISESGTEVAQTLPLSVFVTTTPAEDLKTIIAGRNGECIPLDFYKTNGEEKIMQTIKSDAKILAAWDVNFSGDFFANKKMLWELMVILFISILLMYFILAAQFESFIQPLIVLVEIPIDIAAALGLLLVLGHSLNLMSAIGIVVTCGIIINDSILKIDVMNQLRKSGMPLMAAIHEAGTRRLKAILMTSLTTIVCMAPLLFSRDMGSEMEKPLAIATIGGMTIGTLVSLLFVPLVYWWVYRGKSESR